MTAEVQMVLYEDDSVQVQYVDGSKLQLSPCGSEFLFEKTPPITAHPLEQPERIRQRTQFVISTYREEQLQRALRFRNASAKCPFLSESIIPSEKKKRIFTDISEVRWPSLDTSDAMICMEGGTVKISSLDGHAYLCLPKSQHEFTVHFLCKVSKKLDSSLVLLERKNQTKRDKRVEKADKDYTFGSLSGQRLKNKENELYCHIVKCKGPSEQKSCINGTESREELPLPSTKHTCIYTWVEQCWSVASCPEEWKYPLSLARNFHDKISNRSKIDTDITQNRVLISDVSAESGKEVSVLPKALLLSCPVPHLHRWDFCDSPLQRQSEEEEYSYPELVKVAWYKGITYRLTHKHVNSIEIYPGDGSIFKSEGAYFGNYFTYYSIQEGSEEREEKTYSVNNLPPDKPGSPFSVCSLIKQATRILQHCAKIKLSLSHNYRICCWKMVNQGLNLGWCKLTFPDGQDKLIQIKHPGPFERYVTTVISWCRKLTQTSLREMPTHPSSSVLEENWSVASELEKIQKFNLLLENSGILNQFSNKKNKQSSDHCKPRFSEILVDQVNEKTVSVALKKTSEILQDIDCLLSNSKK
ncbi:uncharacterized protein C5orf34 homolog isoform X3 [Choloepus didactylus]|uniref:uncharacterized protein C5orf34 homolog isoform X3 n=1 Tax=Choloepus didactylus TaxID=27675 RepID=UPI00189DBC32|nr:uncharacterized protein C5orf34 homolog isoform X3 [Choloepus didactylus]